MTRARVVPGLLAALGTLVASWPLTTLLDDGSWVRPVLLLLLLQAAIGMAGRYAGWRTWATATVQVVTVVLAVLALHVGDTLVPTAWDELPFAVNDLLLDARETLTTYSAPAPLSPGVLFVLSLTLPLVGVVVDVLAAGLRMPVPRGCRCSASSCSPRPTPARRSTRSTSWRSRSSGSCCCCSRA